MASVLKNGRHKCKNESENRRERDKYILRVRKRETHHIQTTKIWRKKLGKDVEFQWDRERERGERVALKRKTTFQAKRSERSGTNAPYYNKYYMNNLPYLFSSCCRNTEKRLRQLHGTSSSVKNILYYDTHTKNERRTKARAVCSKEKKRFGVREKNRKENYE